MHRPFETSLAGPSTRQASFDFSFSSEELRLEFAVAGAPFLSGLRGFAEGLWRYDCGELFLFAPSTGRYLEVNLAPDGAWWSCAFSAPRVRDSACSPPQIIEISSELHPDRWRSGFGLSTAEVRRCLGSDSDLRGNITLIAGGCPDENPPLENLHSVAKLGAVDFHRPQDWISLDALGTP